MTVQLLITPSCDTAQVDITVANFTSKVEVVASINGQPLPTKTHTFTPVPFGDEPPHFSMTDTFTGLPAGTLTIDVYETNGVGTFGPQHDPSHHKTAPITGACEVPTTQAPPTTAPAPTTTPETAAPVPTTAPAPTTASAAPTTAAPTTTIATTTTAAVVPPSAGEQTTMTTVRPAPNTLPATGADSAPLIEAGAGFLLVGSVILAATRRRFARR